MLRKTREIAALATEATGEEAVELQTRSLLLSFWESAAGFWGERGTRASWVLSGILLPIVLVNVIASYSMNVWSRVIFDALEKRDSATVLELSILYLPLLAGSVFLTVLQLWARRAEASSRLRKCWRKSNSATSSSAWMRTGPGINLVGW